MCVPKCVYTYVYMSVCVPKLIYISVCCVCGPKLIYICVCVCVCLVCVCVCVVSAHWQFSGWSKFIPNEHLGHLTLF